MNFDGIGQVASIWSDQTILKSIRSGLPAAEESEW